MTALPTERLWLTFITLGVLVPGLHAAEPCQAKRVLLPNAAFTCLNLRELFGQRFKVRYEESYAAQFGPCARTEDPWLMILPCRYGRIGPHGGSELFASVDSHPTIAGRLRRLRCCRVWQHGDDGEVTFVFDVRHFAEIAEVMQPRRRRHVDLSPEQRAEIGRRLREAQADRIAPQAPVKTQSAARGSDPTALDDLEAGQRQAAPT